MFLIILQLSNNQQDISLKNLHIFRTSHEIPFRAGSNYC